MKSNILTVTLFFLSSVVFSQAFFQDSYGENYSFGVELNQNNSKVSYESNSTFQPIDTTFLHRYTSMMPFVKLHWNIGSIKEDDIIYYNLSYGLNINLIYRVNKERSTGNFPIAHNLETGLTYLKGDEYGNAFLGSISITFLAGFNDGELFLGPTLSAGYQFEYNDRLLQVYAKGGFGTLGQIEKSGIIDIDGFNFEANSTYRNYLIGIGVMYRGFN